MTPRKSSNDRQAAKPTQSSERQDKANISDKESEDVEELSSPSTPVIYEIVRKMGDEEMERPNASLWWSGVAAGLSISFSLLAQAILQAHLPDAPWRSLLSGFGYSAGFVMAVLSRQQLFTESTITAVLPVIDDFTPANSWRLTRTWGIVFAANMAGTFVAAAFCTYTPVLTPELKSAMLGVAGQIMGNTWLETIVRAVGAGFLMAMMVWLMPSAGSAQLLVIIFITYLIAGGEFTHVVAGSVEAFLLLLNGQLGFWPMLSEFFVPVLIGNIVGGTVLFAMLAYAQVMNEI